MDQGAEPRLAEPQARLRADTLDMRPAALGRFADERELGARPAVRPRVVDGHQGGEPSVLHQRHADGGRDPDRPEGLGLVRGELGGVVVDDERPAGIEFLDGQGAEIGEAVMPEDRGRRRHVPVAADGEAVAVRIHVGVGAIRQVQVRADAARGDLQDRAGVAGVRGCLAQLVEEAEAALVLGDPTLAEDALGDVAHRGERADRRPVVVQDGRVVEVHPDRLRMPVSPELQFLGAEAEWATDQAAGDHVRVEGAGFRPEFQETPAEGLWMARAADLRVAPVVDQDPVASPDRHRRDRREQQGLDDGPDGRGPAGDGPERRRRPVMIADQVAEISASDRRPVLRDGRARHRCEYRNRSIAALVDARARIVNIRRAGPRGPDVSSRR